MSTAQGTFVWYELETTDPGAAQAFYGTVLGWQGRDAGIPGLAYTIVSRDGVPAGGLMRLPEEACMAGARPAWLGYVAVEDVDAAATRVAGLGGTVRHPPTDIPDVGRFAVISDPQGAVLALFKPLSASEAPPASPDAPGHAGWRELRTSDQDGAFAFYADLLGWTKADALDMGPMGTYQIFAAGDRMIGGMMTAPPDAPSPSWLYYFSVADLDEAVERVGAARGEVASGPHPIPGGGWIAHCRDPQGAAVAFVGSRAS